MTFDELVQAPIDKPESQVSSLSIKDQHPDRYTHPTTLQHWNDFKTDVKSRLQAGDVQVCVAAMPLNFR